MYTGEFTNIYETVVPHITALKCDD